MIDSAPNTAASAGEPKSAPRSGSESAVQHDERGGAASLPVPAGVGASTRATPTPLPARATRLEGALVRVDRALAWLDAWLARAIPAELNPLTQSGRAANFALIVAVVSGVALLLWYSPSVQSAYTSLAAVQGRTLGGWVRAVHRYSSDLAMLLVVVHATRMLFARKFTGARWLPWVSGIGLAGLIWFIGWTGYWLVWDQPAQQVATSSMRLLDALPIFGEPMGRLFLADRLVPSLLFFVVFFLHMLLPLAIAVGLAVHLLRISRVRLLPDWRLGVALTIGLALAAMAVPAPLDAPAAMAERAEHFTVDAWYLAPLALGLRFQDTGLWFALFGTMALTAAMPWLLGRRRRAETFQAVVDVSRCHACTQCVQDCPFDAITMVARTDGKRFESQAFVDPARCVGCGVCTGSCDSEAIGLSWFHPRHEEERIERELALEMARGGSRWVAFVAGDIDSGFALFAAQRWRERLPEYQVQFVPTASWVRSKLVERLMAKGVRGVLVIRDARAEAAARDGNRWVQARLAGERHPIFRPERAAPGGKWLVLDFDPSRPDELARAARRFRSGGEWLGTGRRRVLRTWVTATVLALGLGAAVVMPSQLRVVNPAPTDPEFVFSFKAFGESMQPGELDSAEEASKPVHMRGRPTGKPQRAPVIVRMTVDGVTEERSFRAKGISRDGPALDEWRRALAPGGRAVRVELQLGENAAPLVWTGTIAALPRRLQVLTYEPTEGFRLE